MKATDQTLQQLERALRKVTEKFPLTEEASLLTDIHIRVTQESGEVMVFDDDEQELTRYALEHLIGEGKDSAIYVASNVELLSGHSFC